MSLPSAHTSPVESKRCSSCESERPLDWFETKVTGSRGLLDTATKTCKQCREKQAAFRKREREAKAAAKPSKPSVLEHQIAAKKPTLALLGRPITSDSTSTASAQNIEFEKMQHSFEAIKLLDQNEIDAAANLLLDHIEASEDSDESEDIICGNKGGGD